MKEIQKEMKIQEAIQNLKYLISGNCNNLMDFVEEIEMAIDALEKQIPQKPIEDGYYDLPCVCPCCGQALDFTDHQTVKGGVQE